MTDRVGIIGYPLRHSISPVFQQAALDYYALDIRYEAWETEPEKLPERVESLRHPSVLGANVTIPHKEAVVSFLDWVENLARGIGAVNTIVRREGKLAGYNTDAGAFLRALRENGGFETKGKRVLLLGAGGVARAASFALAGEGIGFLTLVNRTYERAEDLASSLRSSVPEIEVLPWDSQRLPKALATCDLIVNCTSLGMKHGPTQGESPLEENLIPPGALVYDLVYNPPQTPLLKVAEKAGARVLGGLSMLVYQGAAAFELWTDREAPLEVMFAAAQAALQ